MVRLNLSMIAACILVAWNQPIKLAASPAIGLSDLEAWDVNVCGLNQTGASQGPKFFARRRSSLGSQGTTASYYAQSGEFPWFVSIEVKFVSETRVCAGTLIHRNLVITAASCFKHPLHGQALSASISAGSTTRAEVDSHRQTLQMANVCFAKEFDPNRADKYEEFGHDLAVVKLEEDLACSDQINAICLYLPGREESFEHDDCMVAGFELYDENVSKAPSGWLVGSYMQQCSPIKRQHPDESCYSSNSAGPHSPCPGHLGSGLFCRHENSNFRVLTGVLTGGSGCKNGSLAPSSFTDLHKLRGPLEEMLTTCLDLVDDLAF